MSPYCVVCIHSLYAEEIVGLSILEQTTKSGATYMKEIEK